MSEAKTKKPKPSIVKSAAMIPLALQVTADENGLHQIAELTKKVAGEVLDDKKAAEFFHEIAGYFESQHEIDQREKLQPTTWPQLRWQKANHISGAIRFKGYFQSMVLLEIIPDGLCWKLDGVLNQTYSEFHTSEESAKKEGQRLFEEFLKSTLKGGQA